MNCFSQSFQRDNLLDQDWKFFRGAAQGAESPSFNDSSWRKVSLPHDWSIEDIPGSNSPFSPIATGQFSMGFMEGGIGWYRKKIVIPSTLKDKKILLQFDGSYMNTTVIVNGVHYTPHPYGYTAFNIDITKSIKYDTLNVLAVKVNNEGENTRWYTGSGIYRHVWLQVLPQKHFENWGIGITTPEINEKVAKAVIRYEVAGLEKSTNLKIKTTIKDPSGKIVAQSTIDIMDLSYTKTVIEIPSPQLWDLQAPNLYRILNELVQDGVVLDEKEELFGIRTISFDTENGFQLNGKSIKLKGGSVHHDNGPLGACAYDVAEFRKISILKKSGYNAVRTAHNPPSEAFLKACDSLGMLVINELFDVWHEQKNAHDYHIYFDKFWKSDMEAMVFRDRNHPSVIMWSIGNEIPNMDDQKTVEVCKVLADYLRTLDPTRPVTAGVHQMSEKKDSFISHLDIAGYNYAHENYKIDHDRVPARVMYASESNSWDAFEYWKAVEENDWVIGDFIWTAFDYLGEAGIGYIGFPSNVEYYPWVLAYCGDIDISGEKRPQSYYRDVLWNKSHDVHLFVESPEPTFPENEKKWNWSNWHWFDVFADWTWPGYEKIPLKVQVYSYCDEVELFLNGKTFGRKPTSADNKYIAHWDVPYMAGSLKAEGYVKGKKISEDVLNTAGKASRIILNVEKDSLLSNGQDLTYINVKIEDANGILNPKAENKINFDIIGPGEIIAVANANPRSLESFQQPFRKAWKGKCVVIVKSKNGESGDIILKASSEGLNEAKAIIYSQ